MLEPIENQYFMVGRIARAHGVDGTVLIIPELYAPGVFDGINIVWLRNEQGDLIPARIESIRVQEKDERLSFFVKFDHVADKNQADRLKGRFVYVPREEAKHLFEEDSGDALASYHIIDENGDEMGVVDEVIDNPAHPILVVKTGQGEQLIPLVDEYVTEVDKENELIYCRSLSQLDDL
jgi:16S rRNA processing protein RimM